MGLRDVIRRWFGRKPDRPEPAVEPEPSLPQRVSADEVMSRLEGIDYDTLAQKRKGKPSDDA